MPKKKILLLENIHPVAKTELEQNGFDVHLEKSSFADDELVRRASGYHALGIRSKTQVTADVLKKLPDLETVGCFCIGTDQVDLETANSLGTPVFNAPYSNTRSVAELVISELVALSRRLTDRSTEMHRGVWRKTAQGSNEVRGKILGIVGYGHIGTQLGIMAEALGLQVLFYDIVKKLPLGNAKPCDSLHELLTRADFVSFHVPDTPLTRGMMGAKEIASMKSGGYLINTSRGTVVDIPALAEALKRGQLAGAAIDVFPSERGNNSEPFRSELQELENVIMTPHIGGSTEEAQEAIGREVAASFTQFFFLGATRGAVNFPNLDLAQPRAPRIINIHKNVPGVLGAVNNIISEFGGNIVAQHLATDNHIGYMVADVDVTDFDGVLKRIANLPTSLRTRSLKP